MDTTVRRRPAGLVAVSALMLVAVAVAAFLIGEHIARSTSDFSGTITLSNGTQTEGCVKPDNGKEVCGAFVSRTGGGSSLFTTGARVSVEQAEVDQRTILLMSLEL